jgi:hypothetical protein
LFKRKIKLNCEFEKSCNCKIKDKKQSCEECKWYWFIHSGSGYCKALSIPITIAWCKDICYYFQERKLANDQSK